MFDTVDNANLNVQFEIPVVSKAGRGLPFNYALAFNSSVWSPYSSSGSNAWTPVVNWGWAGTTSASTGFMTYTVTQASCRYPQNPSGREYYWNIYDFRFYYDPNGTPHQFDHTVSNWSSSIPCGNGPPSSYTGTLTDGSGYTINLTSNPSATVYPSSGGAIEPPLQSGSGSGSIEDSNGNELTASSGSTTTFTDTLGVTALIVSGAGTPASPVVYSYPNPSGGTSQVTVNYSAYTVGTNFGCSGITEFKPAAENLVSSIVLADGTSYSFSYDSAGRVTSVTLPAGGTIHYAYSGGSNGTTCSDGSTATLTRTMPDGATWTYTHLESGNSWTTTVQDPAGNVTDYDFQGIYETERQVYRGSSTLLETVDTCYNGASPPCTGSAFTLPITQVSTTITTDTNLKSETVTDYNAYGLPTETQVYGYASGAVGPLVRRTIIGYDTSLGNIKDRPSSVTVEDGSGNHVAATAYGYDSSGNLTSLNEYYNATTTIARYFTYGSYGVLATATDFDGHTTTFTNGDCSNSFPTSVAEPMSLTSSLAWNCNTGLVTSVTDPNSQTTSFGYDNLYRLIQTNDPDGGQVSTAYNDAANAFSVVTTTKLNASQNRTDTTMLDDLGRVTETELNTDPAGPDYVNTTYNPLGQVATVSNPHRAGSLPSDGVTSYTYDALGRVTLVTDPDGSTSQVAYGVSASQTCNTPQYGTGFPVLTTDEAGHQKRLWYDALGRLIEVDGPDPLSGNALDLPACYQYDALGDLIQVDLYDPHTQVHQTRAYTYDMLSRLTSATTPESGTTTYSYTAGSGLCSGDPSNVCTRTDARGVTTTYTYDALNRLTSKSYANDPSHTPTARYYYDGPPPGLVGWSGTFSNQIGRLGGTCTVPAGDAQCTGYVTATVNTYDPMGRIASYAQCTPYNCGTSFWFMTYNYDLAGDVTSWTHPAGYTITNTINGAQEITQIESSLADPGHPQYLAKNITYTPWGAEATLENGCASTYGQETGCTDMLETYAYNNRMQPVMIELGSTSNAAAGYCLVYNYYPNVANPGSCVVPTQGGYNGGDVIGVFDQDNANPSLSHTEAYSCDALNRLLWAKATGNSTYIVNFGYDPYGNRTCQTSGGGGPTGGPNLYCFSAVKYSSATNRITNSGYTYDAAGDLTSDGTHTYQWDGEGRMSGIDHGSTESVTYNAFGWRASESGPEILHDPQGRDIGYLDGPDAHWWQEFFGLGGTTLGFYDDAPETRFLHRNALGTTTMTINENGGGPFGDILLYPWGEPWASAEVAGNDQHFAGMNQWDALNLYPEPFRRYSSNFGRWLTPDPLGGDITNPQSLNRYAYALNNPTTLTDPSGLDPIKCNSQGRLLEICLPPGGAVWINLTQSGGWVGNWDEFDILQNATGNNPQLQIGTISGQESQNLATPYQFSTPVYSEFDFIPPAEISYSGPVTSLGGASWAGAFAKSFVTNFPSTTWHSLTSSNGCLNQFFADTASNLNPFTPSASSLAEPAANVINAVKFDSALAYAASRPNYLGGTGLLYPFKSSVFTSALKAGQDVLDAVPLIQIDAAMFQSVVTEYSSAQHGECE